jgi:hypothetical protein
MIRQELHREIQKILSQKSVGQPCKIRPTAKIGPILAFRVNEGLRLVINTREVGKVFLLSDAISIEKFLSPQIVIASGSDKYWLFPCLCKHHLSYYGVNRG